MEPLFALDDLPPETTTSYSCAQQYEHLRAHIQFLLRPANYVGDKLARDVDLCMLKHSLASGRQLCSAQELAPALTARGHSVALVKSAGGGVGTAAFRNLRHTFISVLAAPGGAAAPQLEFIVDPHFACAFQIASPCARYAALQQMLPQCFVGSREQLVNLVEWVSREMEWSFKQTGRALPPWREQRAVLTKWQPRTEGRQCSLGATAISPVASPPACYCVGAASNAAMLGRYASELCQSPDSVLLQRAALLACGATSAPTSPTHSGSDLPRRTSLLSRGLEAAGLRRSTSTPPGRSLPHGCWGGSPRAGTSEAPCSWLGPRIHTVRRTA